MKRKFLACFVLLLAFCVPAAAAPSLWSCHQSLVQLTSVEGGDTASADLSTARFFGVALAVSGDVPEGSTGFMTVNGGRYSFWAGEEMTDVSGTAQTFTLHPAAKTDAYAELTGYLPTNGVQWPSPTGDAWTFARLFNEADGGLNNVTVNWTFDNPAYNGSGTIPAFNTTQVQSDDHFVPYIEFSGLGAGSVKSITWRLVKPSAPEAAITADSTIHFQVVGLNDNLSSNRDAGGDVGKVFTIASGEKAEGKVDFDTPQGNASPVIVRYWTTDPNECYEWLFHRKASDLPTTTTLATEFGVRARLVDGKSNYDYVEYAGMYLGLINFNFVEAKHLTPGTMTVPGPIALINPYNDEIMDQAAAGSNLEVKLTPNQMAGMGYMEYNYHAIVMGENRGTLFWDEGENSLSGKTLSWSFPAAAGVTPTNGVVPKFKSVSEQLDPDTGYFPYVEVASDDEGYMTEIKVRLVRSGDLETPVTAGGVSCDLFLGSRHYYYINEDGQNEIFEGDGAATHPFSGTDPVSYTWTLGSNRIKMGDSYTVDVKVTVYDDPENPSTYTWSFENNFAEGRIQSGNEDMLDSLSESILDALDEDVSLLPLNDGEIGETSTVTQDDYQYIQTSRGSILGRLNRLRVGRSGWHVMRFRVPAELRDIIRSIAARHLRVFPIDADQVSAAGNVSLAADDPSQSTLELLTADGRRVDTTDAEEFLLAGYLEADTNFNVYLAEVQSSSDSDPDSAPDSDVLPSRRDSEIAPMAVELDESERTEALENLKEKFGFDSVEFLTDADLVDSILGTVYDDDFASDSDPMTARRTHYRSVFSSAVLASAAEELDIEIPAHQKLVVDYPLLPLKPATAGAKAWGANSTVRGDLDGKKLYFFIFKMTDDQGAGDVSTATEGTDAVTAGLLAGTEVYDPSKAYSDSEKLTFFAEFPEANATYNQFIATAEDDSDSVDSSESGDSDSTPGIFSNRGSGGGCDAGFGTVLLLALAFPLLRRSRR